MRKAQSAFEYVMMLGGVIFVVVLAVVILHQGFGSASSQVQFDFSQTIASYEEPDAAPPIAVLYQASFENELPEGWRVVSGKWSAENGDFVGTNPPGNNQPGVVYEESWTDYAFSFDFQAQEGLTKALGPIVRFQDEKNYWWIEFYANLVILRPKIDGKDKAWAFMATGPAPGFPEKGKWYSGKVEVSGQHLSVFVDGVKYLDLNVPVQYLVAQGGIGFAQHTGNTEIARFKSVVVNTVPPQPAPPPEPSPTVPPADACFSDDFSSAKGWADYTGSWQVFNGVLEGTLPESQNSIGTAVQGSWTDYYFESRMNSAEGDTRAPGPIIRFEDKDNYWWLECYQNDVIFRPKINGVDKGWVKNFKVGGAFPKKDSWYLLKVQAVGNNLKVWVDGKQVADFNVPAEYQIASGGIGFTQHTGRGERVLFDDVKACPVS
ncbi:MAG: family 16 glycoside hydrolase [Candidatus Micrarchaeota archaeon]